MNARTITVAEDNKIIFGGEDTGLLFPRAACEDAINYHGKNFWPRVINGVLVELDNTYHLTNDERLLGRIALSKLT